MKMNHTVLLAGFHIHVAITPILVNAIRIDLSCTPKSAVATVWIRATNSFTISIYPVFSSPFPSALYACGVFGITITIGEAFTYEELALGKFTNLAIHKI